jgi:hypothetical protein
MLQMQTVEELMENEKRRAKIYRKCLKFEDPVMCEQSAKSTFCKNANECCSFPYCGAK